MAKVICPCFDLSDEDLRDMIREQQLGNLEQLLKASKAGSACGACVRDLEKILAEERDRFYS